MKLAPFVIAAITALALAGCGTTPPTLPSTGPSSMPGTPAGSTPASPATTPSAAKPSLPSTAGALDVSAFETSMFASPSGAIWCAIQATSAWCHFPGDFKGTIPTSEEACPGEQLDVTGVSVSTKVEYFCSGEPTAFPDKNNAGDGLDWFASTGFPWVKKDGFTLATLPYGKKLANGSFVCLSESTGVTCGDTATGIGFKMAKAGVTFIS